MFKSLDIRNFQRHARRRIRFGRVTTIIGPNGSGKTAILRALYWLCFNRPAGKTFIRNGTNKVRARLVVDDHTVERRRTRDNQYRLDGTVYKAIGSDVPEDVTNLMNVRPESFQGQLDAPFWLALSPGQVSREMNEIVDLGLIDDSMSFVAKHHREQKARQQVLEERIATARENVKRLRYVKRMHKQLQGLEAAHSDLQAVRNQVDGLTQTIDMLGAVRADGRCMAKRLVIGKRWVKRLNTMQDRLSVADGRIDQLEQLVVTYQTKRDRMQQLKERLTTLEKQLHEQSEGRCPLCGNVLDEMGEFMLENKLGPGDMERDLHDRAKHG